MSRESRPKRRPCSSRGRSYRPRPRSVDSILDFRTGDHHIDNVQVATAVRRTGPIDVEVEATVLYADKDKQDDYSANVNVLIIAEVL